MSHAYVTYFDSRYQAKGLAMIRSLLAHDPGSSIRVVCLDEAVFQLLLRLSLPGTIPVRLSTIEAGDAELAAAKKNRPRVQYYWTLTPTVLLRLLDGVEEGECLTYVDADLLFFSPLQVIFDEMEGHSVLIHGHNFSPEYAYQAPTSGLYNVGLLIFRRDDEGRKVLAWWRDRCLESCANTAESGQMGDQKYLDFFPSITSRLVVAKNPGVGVAPWNYRGCTLSERNGVPLVNGSPVVFFHYHSAAQISQGCLAVCSNLCYLCNHDLFRFFARPYLEALDESLEQIRQAGGDPSIALSAANVDARASLLVRKELEEACRQDYPCLLPLNERFTICATEQFPEGMKDCGLFFRAGPLCWLGDYPDWESAEKAAGGYDSEAIFAKCRQAALDVRDGRALWERDSVTFNQEEWNWPLLAFLMRVAAENEGRLHLLDFGGSFGSTYMQHRSAFSGLKECTWHIVEQPDFVAAGKAELTTSILHFHETIEEALEAAPINAVLLSSVLQYLPKPYALLSKLRATGLPILLDRTPMLPDSDRITVQHVSASIYKASYACRWLNSKRVFYLLQSAGYRLSPVFPSAVDPRGFWGLAAFPTKPSKPACPTRPDARPTPQEQTPHVEVTGRLRVMQVDDFYPAYLQGFYRRQPDLARKSEKEQTEALLQDAFSAIHAVVPYLPAESCETNYFVQQAAPAQEAWAREHGQDFPGHRPDWELEMIRRRIAHFRPDVLYIADPVRLDGRFLSTLTFRPRLILGWKGADIPLGTDFHGYHGILSGLPRLLAAARSFGAKEGYFFYPGMPRWLADKVAETPKTTDVAFVGSVFPAQHTRRAAMLDTLARAAEEKGFSLALHLNCDPRVVTPAMQPYLRPPLFGLDMMRALAASRIVVDDRARHGVILPDGSKKMDLGGTDTINMRLFETTGANALLLTEALPGLSRYFEPGKEVADWENMEDLVDKTVYYLSHEEERAALSAAGHARCLDEHNMEQAAKRFLRIIHEGLGA